MAGDIIITAISLAEDAVSIQYVEQREQSNVAAIARSILIDAEQIQDELDDLIEVAKDIVDKGVLLIRNPPKRLRRRSEAEVEYDRNEDDDEPGLA